MVIPLLTLILELTYRRKGSNMPDSTCLFLMSVTNVDNYKLSAPPEALIYFEMFHILCILSKLETSYLII